MIVRRGLPTDWESVCSIVSGGYGICRDDSSVGGICLHMMNGKRKNEEVGRLATSMPRDKHCLKWSAAKKLFHFLPIVEVFAGEDLSCVCVSVICACPLFAAWQCFDLLWCRRLCHQREVLCFGVFFCVCPLHLQCANPFAWRDTKVKADDRRKNESGSAVKLLCCSPWRNWRRALFSLCCSVLWRQLTIFRSMSIFILISTRIQFTCWI